MRINELLLTFHILAAAAWIGAALALQVIAARVRPTTPDTVVDEFASDAEAVGKMLFAPAAVVLLVTGVALVVHENLGWTDVWILVGIGALVAAGSAARFLFPRGAGSPSWRERPGTLPTRSATAHGDGSSSLEWTCSY